jgi:hypothetical protein
MRTATSLCKHHLKVVQLFHMHHPVHCNSTRAAMRRWRCFRDSTQRSWHAATWHLCRMQRWISVCPQLAPSVQLSSPTASSMAASRQAARARWRQRAGCQQTAPYTSPGGSRLHYLDRELQALWLCVCCNQTALICMCDLVAPVATVADVVGRDAGSRSCSS